MQAHDIHVALDDQQALEIAARLARLVQAVKAPAFVNSGVSGEFMYFGSP